MEKIKIADLVLGKDYETMETIMEKAGVDSNKGIYYRIKKLKDNGVDIITFNDGGRKPMWLKEDADQIIDIDFSKFRKKSLKKPFKEPVEKGIYTPIPANFVLGIDYETMGTLMAKSKYKCRKDFNLRVINLSVYSAIDLHTKYTDNYTRWWLPIDAEIIISYRKKRVNKGRK